MKHRVTLTITSLLSILLFSLHWADEIRRGLEPGTFSSYGGMIILAVWLCAALVIPGRFGLVILLLGSILASGVTALHMQGIGLVGGRIPINSSGALFWVWTNIALGASGMVSFALAAIALWQSLRRVRQPGMD